MNTWGKNAWGTNPDPLGDVERARDMLRSQGGLRPLPRVLCVSEAQFCWLLGKDAIDDAGNVKPHVLEELGLKELKVVPART